MNENFFAWDNRNCNFYVVPIPKVKEQIIYDFKKAAFNYVKTLKQISKQWCQESVNQNFANLLKRVDIEFDHDHKTSIQFEYFIDTFSWEMKLKLTDFNNSWKVFNTENNIFFYINLGNLEFSSNSATNLKEIPDTILQRVKKAWWKYVYPNLERYTQAIQEEIKRLKSEVVKSEFGTL